MTLLQRIATHVQLASMEGKKIEDRLKDYLEIRAKALTLYNTFGKIQCPALGGYVHFTSEGFNHLIYGRAKKERDKRAQIARFDLLDRAKFIIENSTTFQEYDEDMEYIKVNRHGKYVGKNELVKSWGLVAIVRKFRVKVVIIQVGNGKMQFQSVRPAWFIKQYRDIKLIQTSTGAGLRNDDDEEVLKNATGGGAL